MNSEEIIRKRLACHQLTDQYLSDPGQLLHHLLGIQAQDYHGSKWAMGTRLVDCKESDIDRSVQEKKIIRGWFMRGTLHFINAEDVHWLLDLLGPKLLSSGTGRNRQLGLSDAILDRSKLILSSALKGKKELTRNELSEILKESGIDTGEQRLYHILQHAALEKIIIFGTRKRNEFTFTLLDDWISMRKKKDRDAALTEMAKRYFTTRGPSTIADFAWWSGLALTECRRATELAGTTIQEEFINGQHYFSIRRNNPDRIISDRIHLIPPFDEYVIAYKDRTDILVANLKRSVISSNGIFYPVILQNGKVIGTWKRKLNKDQLTISTGLFISKNKMNKKDILQAAENYARFLGLKKFSIL